jgi:glycerol-3-phosphate acyltransferase PlsY
LQSALVQIDLQISIKLSDFGSIIGHIYSSFEGNRGSATMGVSIALVFGFIVCLITTASVGTKGLASSRSSFVMKTMGFALNQMKIPSIPYQIQILH